MIQFTKKTSWNKVSRANPCPICDRPDWCLTTGPVDSPDAVICARIESAKRVGSQGAGWLHRLRDDDGWRERPRRVRVEVADNCSEPEFFHEMAADCASSITPRLSALLADRLRVSEWSLCRLWVGWSTRHHAYTFPMRAASGETCGIRLRAANGQKWAVRGSRQGLFYPPNVPIGGPLLICEGPTDTAAILDLHLDAVGRPSCTGGANLLVDLVCDWKPETVAIIADADAPGQRGARSLAARLVGYVPAGVRIVTPPVKDAREWVNQGATRVDVLDAIEAAPIMQLRYGVAGGVQ